MKTRFTAILFLLWVFGTKAQTQTSIQVTGFNEDIVAESGTSALSNTTREMDAQSISNYVLCTKGFADENNFTPANTYGIPDDGAFTSPVRNYQMAPYDEENAIYLFPSDTGNLNLVNPSRFTNLSLLTLATEGNASVKITFHFSDGTAQNATRDFIDWFGPVTNPEFFGYGRVKRKNGPFFSGSDYEAAPTNPKFSSIDFTLPCTKTLVSIGFKNVSFSGAGSSRAFILAVSGVERKVIPKIRTTASDTSFCQGKLINFVAFPDSQGTNPVYTWKVNGLVVGGNQPTFSSSTLQNQDVVTCTLRSNAVCAFPLEVVSNSIVVTVIPPKIPKATISVSDSTVCAGAQINFTASAIEPGTAPKFTWKVNGQVVGTNQASFSSSGLQNQDVVTCVLRSNAECVTKDSVISNSIKLTISPIKNPKLNISVNDSTVCVGDQINFTANPLDAGANPSFIWKVNGFPAGSNQAGFSSLTLKNNDKITCSMLSNAECVSPASVVSMAIKVEISPLLIPGASLFLRDSSVCEGNSVEFIANSTNAGNPPIFKWFLNGIASGEESNKLVLPNPKNGDKVSCLITSTENCKAFASIETQTKTVEVIPVYNLILQAPDSFLLDDSSKLILVGPSGGLLSGNGIQNLSFKPGLAGVGSHTIQYAFPGNRCTTPVSKTILVKEEILPCNPEPTTLISMNGDNLNDAWDIGTFNKQCILSASVEIFNRWGISVFKSDNYKNDWFGKKDGETLQPGSYFYTITYKTARSADSFIKNGVLTLVK